jgi:hypothetical protein
VEVVEDHHLEQVRVQEDLAEEELEESMQLQENQEQRILVVEQVLEEITVLNHLVEVVDLVLLF